MTFINLLLLILYYLLQTIDYSSPRGGISVETNTSGNNQSKTKVQQQARGSNNTCITCGNTPHKYQLNCPKLRDMTPNQIYKVMSNSNIECQMCLGLGHRSKDCPAVQDGFLKKCTIKENSQECGKYHCRYLHKPKNSTGVSNQTPKTKQE